MNSLERGHLENFCIKNDIDDHEIDSSISYFENLKLLTELSLPKEITFNKSEHEFVEVKNDLQIDKEVFKEFMSRPINEEKTTEEIYEEMTEEFNFIPIEDRRKESKFLSDIIFKRLPIPRKKKQVKRIIVNLAKNPMKEVQFKISFKPFRIKIKRRDIKV